MPTTLQPRQGSFVQCKHVAKHLFLQSFITSFLTANDSLPLSIVGDSSSSPIQSLQEGLSGLNLTTSLQGEFNFYDSCTIQVLTNILQRAGPDLNRKCLGIDYSGQSNNQSGVSNCHSAFFSQRFNHWYSQVRFYTDFQSSERRIERLGYPVNWQSQWNRICSIHHHIRFRIIHNSTGRDCDITRN